MTEHAQVADGRTRPMSRLVTPLLAVLLAVAGTGLGGCGSRIDDYCSELQSHQQQFAAMFAGEGPDQLLDHLPMLHQLADAAPDDLRDEWQSFVSAVQGLATALHRAGVRPQEFRGGRAPARLSPRQRLAIADAADQLSARDTVEAVNGIDQQARDVCHTNLGLGQETG